VIVIDYVEQRTTLRSRCAMIPASCDYTSAQTQILSIIITSMSSEFELHDLSKKGQVGSQPMDTPSDPSSRPPTYPEESDPKESATASWAWATSITFVDHPTPKACVGHSDDLSTACQHGPLC